MNFQISASRSRDGLPSIKVVFSNGIKDDLELTHFKTNTSIRGCNYLGKLRNHPLSSVAVTGCMNKPGDIIEVTLISEHNVNQMFAVDFYGNAEIIKNPFENGGIYLQLKWIFRVFAFEEYHHKC